MTGVVAEICMARWEKRFRGLMLQNEMRLWMSKVYVDDQDLLFSALKRGSRWSGGRVVWSEEFEKEDEELNEATDKRCMKVVREMSNSIRDDIQMLEDVPSNYKDRKLPVLGFKVWKVETTEPSSSRKK